MWYVLPDRTVENDTTKLILNQKLENMYKLVIYLQKNLPEFYKNNIANIYLKSTNQKKVEFLGNINASVNIDSPWTIFFKASLDDQGILWVSK